MRTVELLAPARDLKCGRAAVLSGADAVYIGGPAYGARAAAPNSLEDVRALCAFAHDYGVKVHVALNTVLTGEELKKARELAFALGEAGADALIVQDLGLLAGPLPPLALHASTQQDNATPAKIRFLEECGFARAVLARELSLPEIAAIRANSAIELEAFVHGALCAGVSGRCYLSAAVTGRSANRGECAQLCRTAQTLYGPDGRVLAADRYLLSMKDLNRTASLRDLVAAGVGSFKIEGRLKDENYVRNVTAWYRRRLDEIIAADPDLRRASFGATAVSFEPDPRKSFNRGFTEYNTRGVKENYANFRAPGYVGEKIGRLAGATEHVLTLKLFRGVELHNGDSLNYFRGEAELAGFRVSRMLDPARAEIFQSLPPIPPGTVFYRSRDAAFEAALTEDSCVRRLALRLTYFETPDGIGLRGSDEMTANDPAEVALALPAPATTPDEAKLRAVVAAKIGRLGGTPYELAELETELPFKWFAPPSLLNELRRRFIAELGAKKRAMMKAAAARRAPRPVPGAELPPEERELGFKANVMNAEAAAFRRSRGGDAVPAYELDKGREPREVLVSKHCLHFCFGFCPKRGGDASKNLFLKIGRSLFRVRADCAACRMILEGPLPPLALPRGRGGQAGPPGPTAGNPGN